MDWKLFFATFATIFLAELGDKTQVAALAISAQSKSLLEVLLGVVLALAVAGVIGVVAGRVLAAYINPQVLKYTAGALLVVMGAWILLR